MNNKKLPRLLQPSMRLYFMCLIAFAVATFFFGQHNLVLSVIELLVLALLALYSNRTSRHRATKLLDYLESVSDGMESTVRDTPLPVVIYNSQTNEIIWSNERFIAITGFREAFFELSILDVVPEFSGNWLLDGKNECPEPVSVGNRKYKVYGSMVLSERVYVAATYWVDVTEYVRVNEEYMTTRPIFAILLLDNYDELLNGMNAKEKSALTADIDEKINFWSGDCNGYICKYDRDRYFFLCEEHDYVNFAKDNFSILTTVHSNTGAGGVHATLSIGIGKGGASPSENFRFASLAVEMALSRGGDQAVVRHRYGFEYFGGHSPQNERGTKVKSRVYAGAFAELLNDVSTVFIMGHKFADFDSIGAAIGICCIARVKGKQARIIVDFDNNYAQSAIDLFMKIPEYGGVFVTEHDAILEADSKSLLVVVDTSRPDKVESETMLLSCTCIAVIDHHRRSAEYIDNAVFNFHVPYASSTSELVTEMLEYLVEKSDMLRPETEALLAGIVLDTKGFSINTGSRTFDAAAFLERFGADMAAVKRLLQSDFETTTARYAIMCTASIYRDGIAIASSDRQQSRLSVPQAADDLLNIEGVHTSFTVAPNDDDVLVSGRSIGNVNVQLILEKLGGGGSRSSAGLQVHGQTVAQVVERLKKAIDEYLNN